MNREDRCRGRRPTHEEMHRHMREHFEKHQEEFCCQYKAEFRNYHRVLKVFRPITILLTLGVLYLLYRGLGAGIATLLVGAVLILKDGFQVLAFRRLERRIFRPVEEMTKAVAQIAEGNYGVRIKATYNNELGMLTEAFNHMAEKLEKGEKLKKTYEENRKDLIANISHDLKTPMSSILGYVEALQSDAEYPVETQERYLKTIYSNTAYMNNLINDLILFSQLDIKKLPFDFQKVSVGDFADELMEELKIDLEEQGVPLVHENTLSEKVFGKIDPKRIARAVRNIVGNAVKYGGEDLQIKTTVYIESNEGSNYIVLSIRDNGPGIPEDMQEKVFERFQRMDHERTKDTKSTGLGLSIAKELVAAHNGEIKLESRLGEGSCFMIYLPLWAEEEGATCHE